MAIADDGVPDRHAVSDDADVCNAIAGDEGLAGL